MADKTYTREQLEGMTKDKLQSLADKRGLAVARSDGSEGEALKEDYVSALVISSTKGSANGDATGDDAEPRLDTTIAGGKYTNEAGELVNAEGQQINEDGSLVETEE